MKLGDRMKRYEKVFQHTLPLKHPVIIRIDGKSFHTLTKGLEKPFDSNLISCMLSAGEYLLHNVCNCKMAYIQSDEISLLLDDREREETEAFFDNKIQKLTSVTASMATYGFNKLARELIGKEGMFDSRVFILPDEEVPNYFLWRIKDWERNSIQMLGRAYFSQKELHKKPLNTIIDMLFDKGVQWSKLKPHLKNGTILIKGDREIKRVSRKFNYKTLKKFIENRRKEK